MKIQVKLLGLILIVLGCSTPPPPKAPLAPKYTAKEKSNMTMCVGMTDTARMAADAKSKGVSAQELKDRRTSGPMLELYNMTIDKVFQDKFTLPFDYAISFFDDCALNIANVPKDRVKFANYCNVNSMLAGRAHEYKKSGMSKEKVYEAFAQFGSETPRRIVDQVYAGSNNRAASAMNEWNSCIGPITGK